jgi:hypothetical protein
VVGLILLTALLASAQDRPPQPQDTPAPQVTPAPEPAAKTPPQEPKAATQEAPPPITSETLKTLIDKVRDRVGQCDNALKASGLALVDFEAEITGKTLGDINFKQLADHVGQARAAIHEALGDTDTLLRKMDNEIMASMKEEEGLLFKDGTKQVDTEKAAKLTDTIRTVLELHDILPGDSLAKDSLEMLADTIDRSVNPETMDDFLDVSNLTGDIVRAIMNYRRSLKTSVETLKNLETVLTVLESKSRDLASLISREGDSPDKASMLRVQALVKEITENRSKALSIFKRIGRKVRDATKKPGTAPANTGAAAPADPNKTRMDSLKERYLKK